MGRQVFNESFSLEIPDAFAELDAADYSRLGGNGGGPYRWGARDPEKHLLIVALWERYPALLSWLADLKSMAKKNARLSAGAYEGHSYRFLGFFTPPAGEAKAEGYRFSYEDGGKVRVVDTFLVREGKTVYSFLCSGPEESMDADHACFCRIMESLELV